MNTTDCLGKQFLAILLFFISFTTFTQDGPADVSNTDLAFWLRADAGVTTSSGNVTSWADQSTNGNNGANGTPPTYIASSANWNSRATISFSSTSLVIENDGTINDGNQAVKTMTIAFRSPTSVVNGNEVIYEQGGGTNGLIYYINGDGTTMTLNMGIYSGDGVNYTFESVAITAATKYIATLTYDGSGFQGYLNNTLSGLTALTGGSTPIPLPSHTGDIRIGSANSTNRGAGITISSAIFTGEIAEIIQYNRVLTGLELTTVSNYLSAKYEIAISDDLYDGDQAINGDYDSDFRLIGNDGTTSATSSADDYLTITDVGLGSGDYLTWGNDGAATSLIAATGLSNTYRTSRIWSLDLTGSTTAIDNISFPDGGGTNYRLVLDDDQAFSTTPIQLSPDNTSGGTISFDNVDLSSFGGIIYLTIGADIGTIPGGVSTPAALWFKTNEGAESSAGVAATNNDPVQFWLDQSGNGHNAIQSVSGERALFDNSNTINGNPVLTFDGTNDNMAIDVLAYNDVSTLNEATFYAVAKTTKSSEGIIVSYDRSSFYRFSVTGTDNFRFATTQGSTITDFTSSGTNAGNGTPHILGADFDGVTTGNQNLYFDGELNATTNTGTGFLGSASELPRYGFISSNSEASSFDGTNGGGEFEGDIAEIIYFENLLSATEKQQIESYLAVKYGITLSSDTDGDNTAFEAGEGDYLAADGVTVVWDADANSGYHNSIAGIAEDSNSGLSQASSKSEVSDAIFTVTDNSLNDGDYIMWGHNNAAFAASTSSSSFASQLDRFWKVELTESTNNIDQLEIDLAAAFATFLPIESEFGLLIDDNESFSSPLEVTGTLIGSTYTLTNVDLSSFSGDIFIAAAYTPPTPGNVSLAPTMWYKADAGAEEANLDAAEDGDAVRFWKDKSGFGNDAQQDDFAERPRFDNTNTINFNPTINFDGNTHIPISRLNYNITTNTLDELTIYSIVKSTQATEGIIVSFDRSSFFRFAINHNNVTNFGLSTTVQGGSTTIDDTNASQSASDGFVHLIGGEYSTSTDTKRLILDGSIIDNFPNAHGATGGMLGNSAEVPRFGYISANSEASTFNGSDEGSGYDGSISEIIYFEGTLPGPERAKVESYLAIKYGITTTLDYLSSAGTVVWDNSSNAGYNNTIAAIARDEDGTLNQSQSKSESTGSILTLSDAALSDGDYVFVGSNNGDLSIISTGTGSKDARFNRIWKTEITGSTTNVDQITFDLSNIVIKPTLATSYALLLDNADDFSTVVREVAATSITNGILQFDNIDLSGVSYLSVAITPDLDDDGVGDLTDLDDDNDGILDTEEGNGATDTDSDGIADSRDIDSDNDGIGDLYESGAENAGTPIATLDANGDGIIDTGSEGANGFDNRLEIGDVDGGGIDYTVSDSDGDGVVDFRDLDSDNNGISDLAESGRSTSIDSDDDGVFEGADTDQDGVPDEVDTQNNLLGSTLTANDQDGTGEPDFRDLDNDDDGTEDIDEVQLTDTTPDDGRLDGATDADGDGVILERDNDDSTFGGIDLASLVSGAGNEWYSYRSGNWSDPNNWTLDPSGSTRINPGAAIPNNFIDNVTILNGDEITLDFDALVLSSFTVEQGGIVNLGTTINHNFNQIDGAGIIRIASNDFPGGDLSNFAASTGGTLEYVDQSPAVDYELTVARTLNNLIINSTSNTITQKADLTLNGNLTITSGTLQINDNTADSYTDNTTPLSITINGAMTIDASGAITVGNVDAATEVGSSDVYTFHQLEILGDLTNNGSMSYTNLSPTSIADGRYRDKYPTATDLDNQTGSNDIPAAEFGVVEVLFTNGAADQQVTLNGTSDFYRIEVKKGTSQTYIAEFDASSTANFRLLGRIAMNQSDDSGTTPNMENHRALGLEAGILKLGDNIVINQISKEDTNGNVPSTQGGNRNYMIDVDAQLWLSSNAIVTKSNDWGIHPFGRLKVSDDATLTFTGAGQRTILVDNQGVFEMTGGTVNITQFRNKTGADGAPRGSFIMTGGILNVGGGDADGSHAIFSVPWEEQNFILTPDDPANPPVINLTIDGNRGKDRAAI